MSLKASFFNKTIFKSNMKRLWWISALGFIAYLTFAILPLAQRGSIEGFAIMSVIICIASAILPTIIFSYLDSASAVSCMHALPIKRKAHYITNLVTIYTLLLTPAILSYIIGFIYIKSGNIPLIFKPELSQLAEYFAVLVMCITIFSSGAVLANMVTGNPISAGIFSALFIFLPYYTEMIIAGFLQQNIHGIWSYNSYLLDNLSVFEINTYMIIATVIWALIFVASWFLYKNRRLETNGDIICFDFLKPIFEGCVSFFVGILGYFYFVTFNLKSVFYMLPFGLLGLIIANMLSKKAFTFKGALRHSLVYIAGVIVIYLVIAFDLTGFERRIPNIDDVKSVQIVYEGLDDYSDDMYSNNNVAYIENGEKYYIKDYPSTDDIKFFEEKDIKNVMNLHSYLIENRNRENNYNYMPIVYTLKNGKTLKRRYSVDVFEDKNILRAVYETKQMRLNKYSIFRDYEKTITGIRITDERLTSKEKLYKQISGTSNEAKTLYDALYADILTVGYNTIVNYNDSATKVQLYFTRPAITKDGKLYDKQLNVDVITIGITNDFVKTKALLEEYGLYDKIVKPSDINRATVLFNNKYDKTSPVYYDRDKIEMLYNFCYDNEVVSNKRIGNIHSVYIDFYDKDEKILITGHNYPGLNEHSAPDFLVEEAKKWVANNDNDYDIRVEYAEKTYSY